MTIGDKQIEAVSALPGPKRYAHFVKAVADSETAWGLRKDGWALATTDEGERAFPLWPGRQYAERCATGDWDGYESAEIEVYDLLLELLPMLKEDGVMLAVFMTPSNKAATLDVDVLMGDLNKQLGL